MKNAIRMSVVFACTALLTACGGGAKLKPGKDNAAAAAFASSQGAGSAPGGILDLLRQNAGANVDLTVDCPHGGSAALHLVADTSQLTQITYDIAYDNCSYNGTTHMTGPMSVTLGVDLTDTSVSAGIKLKGRVTFSGDISDFVDADVTMALTGSGVKTAEGSSVSCTLTGTVKTSSDSYTYNAETSTVVAGHLEADSGN